METNPLGHKTDYKPYYDPTLLFPIARAEGRDETGVDASLCIGYDRWNCYELGWLGPNGKPEVRTLRIVYPASSRCLVESKSLKLYLGSFILSRFDNERAVAETISRDLSALLGAEWLEVQLSDSGAGARFSGNALFSGAAQSPCANAFENAVLVDDLAVNCETYLLDAGLLQSYDSARRGGIEGSAVPKNVSAAGTAHGAPVTLVSHLLKTNCPMTGQPDWATVLISYRGTRHLVQESLVRYLVSYREHGGYHEVCCEQIFTDLLKVLQPETLVVKCFFTRRGGIDITPCRFFGSEPDRDWDVRGWRQ